MEMNIFILKQEGGGWKGSCLREGLQMLGDFFPPSGTGEAAAYSESWSSMY